MGIPQPGVPSTGRKSRPQMPDDSAMPDDVAAHTHTHTHAHTRDDPNEPDEPDDSAAPQDTAALDAAATRWQRKGYRVRYRDPFLVQLIRRDQPGWRSAPFLALAIATLIAAVASFVVALQRRPWHVITLVIGPDRRVLTHHHRSPHPPEP